MEESLKNPPAGPTGQAGPPPIPLGRLGTPQDIADLVSFLVSDRAKYITGEDINLCRRRELRRGTDVAAADCGRPHDEGEL